VKYTTFTLRLGMCRWMYPCGVSTASRVTWIHSSVD